MAPTPVDNNSTPQPTELPKGNAWGTAGIVAVSIFGFFVVALTATLIGFYLHRRSERNKLPPQNRPTSYHPFRTSSDKSGLLANAAPSPENDKAVMFARERDSSVSLVVNTNLHHGKIDRRVSVETPSLIPLHVTPADETHNPMDGSSTPSGGSGVSNGSSRFSRGSIALSPVPLEGGDLGSRTRARSTSTSSVRYYSNTPTEVAPQIPKIVHTPSQ